MPIKHNDDESVHNTTLLSHFNILALINELINKNKGKGKAFEEATVAVIPVNPNDKSIDESLTNAVNTFITSSEDRVSIVLGRGKLAKIYDIDQITGCSHWTGLHLRRMDGGTFQAYHMDSFPNSVPPAVTRILNKCGIDNVTQLTCNPQTDGHSCGYHAVNNLKTIHEINDIGDGQDILNDVANYKGGFDSFKSAQQAWLQTQFNQKTETRLNQNKQKSVKKDGVQTEDVASRYQANLYKIVSSDDDYLAKIRKIIEIQDRVNDEVSDETKRAKINSLLNFENYYNDYLSAFAQNLFFKHSSDDSGTDEAVKKRDVFFIKLTTEITQNPKDFLEILTAIDKYPELFDTLSEINKDEDFKKEIEKKKKFLSGVIEETEETEEGKKIKNVVTQFISQVDKVYEDNITTPPFKDRLDQLVNLLKSDYVPGKLKESFDFLSKVDKNNFLPAIIPEYFQPQPKLPFGGWGLEAVFNDLNLKIEGKEVNEIHDNNGINILEGLKKTFKDDPKLFAYAVIDFFRRADGDINLVYKGHPQKKLLQSDKKTFEIKDNKPREVTIVVPAHGNDTPDLLIERFKTYSNDSATKTPTKVILTDSDKEVLEVFKQHINQRFKLLEQLLANDPNKIAIIPGSKRGDEISCSFANGLAVDQWKDRCEGDKDRGDEMARQCRELFKQESQELEKKYPKQVFFGNVGMKASDNFLPQFPVGGDKASYEALFNNTETGYEHNLILKYKSLCKQLGIKDEVKDEELDKKISNYRNLLFGIDAPLANKTFIHVWGANVDNFNCNKNYKIDGGGQASAFTNQVEGVFGICSTPIYYTKTKKTDLMAACKTHQTLVDRIPSPDPKNAVVISMPPPITQLQAPAPAQVIS